MCDFFISKRIQQEFKENLSEYFTITLIKL
jgi:hypothetical protein